MKKFLLTAAAILLAVLSVNAQFSNGSKSKSSSGGGDMEWRGEVNVGMAFGNTKYDGHKYDGTMVAPVATFTYGIKFNDYLFVGAGAGFKYMTQSVNDDKISSLMIPIFAEVKAFIPVNETFTPFVMADFGYSVRLSGEMKVNSYGYESKSDTKGGLCYKFGAGVAIDSFTLALGYDCQKFGVKDMDKDFTSSGFFFSLGYAF